MFSSEFEMEMGFDSARMNTHTQKERSFRNKAVEDRIKEEK